MTSFLGQIGITLNTGWSEPLDPNDASDLEASETDMQFGLGWYAQPILMDGKYPTIMREKVRTLRVFCIDKTSLRMSRIGVAILWDN